MGGKERKEAKKDKEGLLVTGTKLCRGGHMHNTLPHREADPPLLTSAAW